MKSSITQKPVWLSVSGFKTWISCRRRWWYEKVAGRREPPSPILATGLAVHAALEEYLRTGAWGVPEVKSSPPDWTPLDRLQVAGGALELAKYGTETLDHLRVIPHGRIEHKIRIMKDHPASPFSLNYFGAVDFCAPEPPLVVDHKTTGDLKGRFIPSKDDLTRDPQLLLYGALLWGGSKPPIIQVAHHYYQTTRKGKPFKHEVLGPVGVNWGECEAMLGAFVEASDEMAKAIPQDAASIPYNQRACRAYGRMCPHAEDCTASPANRETAVTQAAIRALLAKAPPLPKRDGKMSSLRERLRAKAAGGTPPAPAKAPERITPPDAPPTPTPTLAQASEATAKIVAVVESGVPYADAWASNISREYGLDPEVHLVGVRTQLAEDTPPFRPEPVDLTPQQHTLTQMVRTRPKGLSTKDAKKIALAPDQKRWSTKAWSAFLAEGCDLELWTYSASRVLPHEPDVVQDVQDVQDVQVDAPTERLEAPGSAFSPLDRPLGVVGARPIILVGCSSRSLQAEHLLTALDAAGVTSDVATANGVTDWRLVKFGDGPKHLASRLTLALRDGLRLPPVLYCEAGNGLATCVVPVLDAAGYLVIRREG